MSISPKLSGSGPDPDEHPHWGRRHQRERYQPEVLRRLLEEYDYQLKFVVDHAEEILEIEHLLADLGEVPDEKIWLMPQGTTMGELEQRESWLAAACAKRNWRYCPRRQIEWFGTVRGT